jgi:hypothetical protein
MIVGSVAVVVAVAVAVAIAAATELQGAAARIVAAVAAATVPENAAVAAVAADDVVVQLDLDAYIAPEYGPDHGARVLCAGTDNAHH